MRIKTHGPVNLDNTHPFWVNEETVMMHNGILTMMPDDKEKSDTRIFIEEVLADLSNNWLDNAYITSMIEDSVGWSKFAFLTTDKSMLQQVYIINEDQGDIIDGMWFSSKTGVENPKSFRGGRQLAAWKQDKEGVWRQQSAPKKRGINTGAVGSVLEKKNNRGTYEVPVSSNVSALDDQDFDTWLNEMGISTTTISPLSLLLEDHENNSLWGDYITQLRKENGNNRFIIWQKVKKNWECLGCDEEANPVDGDCDCWNKLCLDCVRFTVDCTCHMGYVTQPEWCADCPNEAVAAAVEAYVDSSDGSST